MIALTKSDLQHMAAWGAVARIRSWFETRSQQKIDRDAFRTLLSLDDTMLRDIGVTRDEVRRAADLPLSVNAALELETLAKTRRSW